VTEPFGDERPVIRDRRRLDPNTGEVRAGAADQAAPGPPPPPNDTAATAGPSDLEVALAERTADLQRVQAEYANYRRRVDRDRQAVGETALASVLSNLLPVVDDIDRARAHGEVVGGFAQVADSFDAVLGKLGLQRYGDSGDPFDPTLHEALTHGFSTEVAEPVCAQILQPGYRVGERILRPARVAVLEPETAVLPDQPEPRTAAGWPVDDADDAANGVGGSDDGTDNHD
jgi:molecular chaperone GrpE